MILKGTDFGFAFGASGVQGLFGEKHKHQKFLGPLGPDFAGCTFVTKTTPLGKRFGNMEMEADGVTPKEFAPKCILPNLQLKNLHLIPRMFWHGIMLNSVNWSSPGTEFLLNDGRWQDRTKPFGISLGLVSPTIESRTAETRALAALFAKHLPRFKAKIFIQWDFTCRNLGMSWGGDTVYEAKLYLKTGSALGVAQMPKFSILTPIDVAKEIMADENCDAGCVSNAIHWSDIYRVGIDRKKLFGTDISPLLELGGGALSGAPLFPLVVDWLRRARKAGINKPILVGGGVMSADNVVALKKAGASAVFIGSVATLRPWRVKNIIKKAYELF